jgi:hypothetical protein
LSPSIACGLFDNFSLWLQIAALQILLLPSTKARFARTTKRQIIKVNVEGVKPDREWNKERKGIVRKLERFEVSFPSQFSSSPGTCESA